MHYILRRYIITLFISVFWAYLMTNAQNTPSKEWWISAIVDTENLRDIYASEGDELGVSLCNVCIESYKGTLSRLPNGSDDHDAAPKQATSQANNGSQTGASRKTTHIKKRQNTQPRLSKPKYIKHNPSQAETIDNIKRKHRTEAGKAEKQRFEREHSPKLRENQAKASNYNNALSEVYHNGDFQNEALAQRDESHMIEYRPLKGEAAPKFVDLGAVDSSLQDAKRGGDPISIELGESTEVFGEARDLYKFRSLEEMLRENDSIKAAVKAYIESIPTIDEAIAYFNNGKIYNSFYEYARLWSGELPMLTFAFNYIDPKGMPYFLKRDDEGRFLFVNADESIIIRYDSVDKKIDYWIFDIKNWEDGWKKHLNTTPDIRKNDGGIAVNYDPRDLKKLKLAFSAGVERSERATHTQGVINMDFDASSMQAQSFRVEVGPKVSANASVSAENLNLSEVIKDFDPKVSLGVSALDAKYSKGRCKLFVNSDTNLISACASLDISAGIGLKVSLDASSTIKGVGKASNLTWMQLKSLKIRPFDFDAKVKTSASHVNSLDQVKQLLYNSRSIFAQ